VSSDLSSLSEEHVLQIGRILDALERSSFDYLQLEVGDLKITVGKGDIPVPTAPAPAAVAPSAPAPQTSASAPQAAPAAAAVAAASPQAGTIEIKSPIMGLFYAQPEPSAPPFVTVGATVSADTTVALVEVMKTFNAVTAGVSGKVVEVCVENGQLVEFGQVLFRVFPE
jgi:acetyl-CoA carboxylase biotin carboxyl carrier protein